MGVARSALLWAPALAPLYSNPVLPCFKYLKKNLFTFNLLDIYQNTRNTFLQSQLQFITKVIYLKEVLKAVVVSG